MLLSAIPLVLLSTSGCASGLAARAAAGDSVAYHTEDVRYASDTLTLAALLMLPGNAATPLPAAVILQGSGTSDRTNQWSRAIAEVLVDAGMAVLLTDKRGSGASEGDWRSADFDDLAQDALAAVSYLATRPEVNSQRIGLVGLSQGGWVAPLAAAGREDVAFVIAVSGAAVSFAEQSFHEMGNTARQAGLPESQVREVLALNRAAGRYILTGDWSAYERARQRGLQTPWRPIAQGFPDAPTLPIWTFLRGVVAFDPMPYWLQLTQPVLVLYGADDERDNVPVAESVRRLEYGFASAAKENYRIVVVPDAGHSFIDPARKELMPEFTKPLTAWVCRHVATRCPS